MYQWRTTLWLPVEPWCKTMIFYFYLFLIYKRKDTSRFIILGSGWCHRRKWGGPLSGRGRVFCSLCGWRHHADTKTLFWKYSCLWPLSWISVGSARCNSNNNEERQAIFRSLQDLWQWWRNPPMSRKIPLSEWWITSAWQKRENKTHKNQPALFDHKTKSPVIWTAGDFSLPKIRMEFPQWWQGLWPAE